MAENSNDAPGKTDDEKPSPCGSDTADADQRSRPYYYDDSHGYENFDPGSELEDEDEDGSTPIDGESAHDMLS
jgi:hypothetical protein